jgi:signal peptidase I
LTLLFRIRHSCKEKCDNRKNCRISAAHCRYQAHVWQQKGRRLSSKPNKWIALILGLLLSPIGMLYVGAPRLAVAVFAVPLLIILPVFFHVGGDTGAGIFGLILIVFGLACTAVAYRIARDAVDGATRQWYSRWYGLLAVFALAWGAIALVRIFWYEPFRAPSTSMVPTVTVGANLIVKKWGYGHFSTYGINFGRGRQSASLERGDIIVFDYPFDTTQTYMKRIVGLPGDKIVYRNRHLFVNNIDARSRQLDDYEDASASAYRMRFQEKLGAKEYEILLRRDPPAHLPEPRRFALRDMCSFDDDEIRCEVPAGNYFVLGDNRDNSADSRFWGFVRSDLVIGKVIQIVN